MKKQIQSFLSFVSFMAIGMSSMAWADGPAMPARPSIVEGSQSIIAETNVTRDAIDQMLRRMADQSANVEFNAGDFRAKSTRFQSNVAGVMQAFENQLRGSILRKLNYWAQRYNAIYHSTTLAPEQKQQLLVQQLQVIRGQEQLIEQEYQTAIKDLYQAVGDVPLQINFRVETDPSRRDRRGHDCARNTDGYIEFSMTAPRSGAAVRGSMCRLPESSTASSVYSREHAGNADFSLRAYEYEEDDQMVLYDANGRLAFSNNGTGPYQGNTYHSLSSNEGLTWLTEGIHVLDKTRLYPELFYPAVSQGCRTQICLALSASQMTTYLGLVQTSIDREIKVILADGTTQLVLRPTSMNLEAALTLIASVDYPVSAQNLPFDTE